MKSLLKNTNNTRPIFIDYNESKVIRSDNLTLCDENDIDYLVENKITCIIDLRNLEGKELNPLLFSEKFDFHNVPLKYTAKEFENESEENEKSMATYYMFFVKQYEKIKQVFDIILCSKEKVLINCAFGRDRTGTIAALVQMLCNCKEEEIIDDYAITDKIFCSLNLENLFKMKKYINYEFAKDTMKRFIQLFKNEFKNPEKYFLKLGYSMEEIKILKHKIKFIK